MNKQSSSVKGTSTKPKGNAVKSMKGNTVKSAKGSPAKSRVDSKDDKEVLDKILDIKIPEKFYSKPNLVLRDLLRPGDTNLVAGITKALFSLAPSVLFGDSTVVKILVRIIALLISNAIPYEEVKVYIVSKMLKIIKNTKVGINFAFTESFLKLFKKKPASIKIFRNLSFAIVLPVVLGSFAFYKKSNNEENMFKYLEEASKAFLTKNFAPFNTETKELTGQTREYLVSQRIIKREDSVVKLEKLGIYSSEISKLNPNGITIIYNPILGSAKPLNLRFTAHVPYLDNATKFLSGDITVVVSQQQLETVKQSLLELVKFYIENLQEIDIMYSSILENISLVERYATIKRAHDYTISDLRQNSSNEAKIKAYENSGIKIIEERDTKSGLARKYSLPELAISQFIEMRDIRKRLSYSSLDIEKHSNVILEASNSVQFAGVLRANLNIIKDTESKLRSAKRDVTSATLKNINILVLRIEDTASVLSSAIQRIKKYDRTNPASFFSSKITPIVLNEKK